MKAAIALSGLALVGGAFAACSSHSDESNGGGGAAQVVAVTLTNKNCAPEQTVLAPGKTKFEIKNDGGTKVSEVELMSGDKILAEKEGLAPGFTGSFSADLKPGRYDMYCPGADTPRTTITVAETAAAATNTP